jgi:phosphatidylglycerophosphatase A
MTGERSAIPFQHPARLAATCCGCGLLPGAPGTWGSLAALPPGVLILWWGGVWWLVLACVLVFALGWWASDVYAGLTSREDPGEVVIDEVAGQWIALLAALPDIVTVVAAFLLFRLFDIVKPWPVSLAERRLKGGLGVMADDAVAGFFAAIGVFALRYALESLHV